MRDHDGQLTFAPRLPSRLQRLSFRLLFRGRRLKVDVNRTRAFYTLLDGRPLEIEHHGQKISISRDTPVERTIPPSAERPTPDQPPGRAPWRRAEPIVT
jgi:alpha,alpha-trehalose phosphorylase